MASPFLASLFAFAFACMLAIISFIEMTGFRAAMATAAVHMNYYLQAFYDLFLFLINILLDFFVI